MNYLRGVGPVYKEVMKIVASRIAAAEKEFETKVEDLEKNLEQEILMLEVEHETKKENLLKSLVSKVTGNIL